MRKGIAWLLLSCVLLTTSAMAQTAVDTAMPPPRTGTLIVDVAPYTSEKSLSRKVVRQLDSATLDWGVQAGQVVFSMLGTRFVDFPLDRATKYGGRESVELPAGEYRVTGVGLEMTTSYTADLLVKRGAFVNEDVVVFRIEPGRTTTLAISPVIKRDTTMNIDFWTPALTLRVRTDVGDTQDVALNERGAASIAWPAYAGPLKRASR